MALSARQLQSIIELIRQDPDARRQLLSALEMDKLVEVPSRMDRVEATLDRLVAIVSDLGVSHRRMDDRLNELAEAQKRTEARVEELAEAQKRTEARLEALTIRVDELAEAQKRTEEGLQKLTVTVAGMQQELRRVSQWQEGEDGRRKGEQYERRVQLRANQLLHGGRGGGLHYEGVFNHLLERLNRLPRNGHSIPEEADPLLADLVWWKGEHFVVAEISLVVDRLDVVRAAQRAATLRRAGVEVLPLVLGEEWAVSDTRHLAEDEKVAWKVGDELSSSLIEYRQLLA